MFSMTDSISLEIYRYNIPVPQSKRYSNRVSFPRILPVVVLDKPPVIPIDLSHIFFYYRESNQPGNVFNSLPKITKRCASVHAVLVGVDITLYLTGIRH